MFEKKTDIEELSSAIAWGREKKALSLINKIDDFTVQDDKLKYTALIGELNTLRSRQLDNDSVFRFFSSEGKQNRIIEAMINKMTDFSQQTKKGNTALIVAMDNFQTGLAEKILEKMDDVDQQNENGNTAFIIAIKNGQMGLAKKILEKMDNTDQQNVHNETALSLSISEGYPKLAMKIIEKMTDFNQVSKNNDTNLMYILKFSSRPFGKVAKALIDKMTDFNQIDDYGLNALMLAIKEKNTSIALKIIAKMDDFSQVDNRNKTAIMLAEERGKDEIVNAIKLKQGDYEATLINLIKQGKKDEAKKLFEEKPLEDRQMDIAIESKNVQQVESILAGKSTFSPIFNNLSNDNALEIASSLKAIAKSIEEKYVGTNDNKTIAPTPKLEPKSK